MASGDFFVVDSRSPSVTPTKYQTKAGQTAIKVGEWVVQDGGGDEEYVLLAADGQANSVKWVGVAASNDTVTASADGYVFVYDDPQYLFRGKPTTAGNLAAALINTQVTLDVDGSGNQTIDENDVTNGTLFIRGYNVGAGTIDVQMAQADHLSIG